MQWCVTRTAIIFLLAAAMAGCGGSSSASKTVVQVTLTPESLSMVAGDVKPTAVSASNSAGGPVSNTTFTYNTSNPQLVTVSPAGQVCAGVWDSIFVVCNGVNASGTQVTGTATITATSAGVTSAPITISVHPSVTSITLTQQPAPGTCLSNLQTFQFAATAIPWHHGHHQPGWRLHMAFK